MLNVKGGGGADMRSSLAAFRATLGPGGAGAARDESDDEEEEEEGEGPGGAAKKPSGATAARRPVAPAGSAPAAKSPKAGPRKSPATAATSTAAFGAPIVPAAGAPPPKVTVKVVVKGAKSLPATSLAGIKEQQLAMHAQEEKQNHLSPGGARAGAGPLAKAGPTAAGARGVGGVGGGGGGRVGLGIGGAHASAGNFEASGSSAIPSQLPKTANALQFIPNELLRNLPVPDVQKVRVHTHRSVSCGCGCGCGCLSVRLALVSLFLSLSCAAPFRSQLFDFYAQSTPSGEAKDRLRKPDLEKLATDLLERLRRFLGEEMRRQGISASAIPAALERELGFVVRGKNEEERKVNLVIILLQKAGSKTPSISKSELHTAERP